MSTRSQARRRGRRPARRGSNQTSGPSQSSQSLQSGDSASASSSTPTDADAGGQDARHLCMACGKVFSRRGALEAHINTHTGAKPYACHFPGCKSAFAARSNLLRHHRIHGKEFAEAAASPQIETTFEAPIVNDQVVGQDLENIQWMTPNQPSRGYTRYSVPTEIPGAGPSSLASASMSSAVDPDASAGASTASDNDAGDVAEGVNPWEVSG